MVTWCQEAGASGTASTVSSAKVLHECRDFTEADPDPVSLGSAGLAMWDPRERGGMGTRFRTWGMVLVI